MSYCGQAQLCWSRDHFVQLVCHESESTQGADLHEPDLLQMCVGSRANLWLWAVVSPGIG